MTDTTAALHDVTAFDGRIFPFGEWRRAVRLLVAGAVVGLGTVAAAAALVTAATMAAAWIINTAFATHPYLVAQAPIGPAAIALADHYPALADAADLNGSIRVAADAADALTFEAKWAPALAAAFAPTDAVPLPPQPPVEAANSVASLAPAREAAQPAAPAASEKRVTPPQAHNKPMPLPDPDSRTAVYDIAAHTVYLPNGERLEAHSGLGSKLDDPRYVNLKDRGPTPPNVYDLALREQPFHEVRALRLNPVGGESMFGRDGILAHSYMLGASGQSNGCVSFKDYPAFLHAYLRGEVDRLVVVPHLENTPWRAASYRRGPARRYAANNP
jgi:hypothetical protein